MASEVLIPSSSAEAAELFGDGAATTVIGGGTAVLPEITAGTLDPGRVLVLTNAGLDGITTDGDRVTVGATTSVDALLDLAGDVPALAACAQNVADFEVEMPLAPAWLRFLIAPHHVNYHLEHHLFMTVPHYKLPAAHRLLAASGVLARAEVAPNYLHVLRRAASAPERAHAHT